MQLTREEIKEKLKEILLSVDSNNQDKINNASEEMNLVDDFGFTSVNILFLVIAIEETFEMRFEDVSMSDFATLGDVINYIEKQLK